jgi:hypothetical protein
MTINDRVRVGIAGAVLVALVVAGGGAARAQYEYAYPPPPPLPVAPPIVIPTAPPTIVQPAPAPPRAEPWQIAAGFRTALLRSAGYDPFATDDSFTQFSVTATRAFRTGPTFATAVGVAWDTGGASAQARGSDTNLSLTRLGGLVEERWAPRPWVYAFARVSPAWLHGTAKVTDPTIAAPLRTTFSTFSLDASLGGALRVGPRSGSVGLWLLFDSGYGWAPDQRIALAPALPDQDSNKAGVTTFADLAPRGVFFRGAVALAF